MPWTTPTLKQLRGMTRDSVAGALATATISKQQLLQVLNASATVGNSVLRVLADATTGLCHLTLKYVEWVSRQMLPDTAEREWLERHGDIWLKNADGSNGRKPATYAEGTAKVTGANYIHIPAGTRLVTQDGVEYEMTIFTQTNNLGEGIINVRALDPGSAGNRITNDPLSFIVAVAGINNPAITISITGGTNEEEDEDLRQRVLDRIQKPPMGGDADDYVAWAKSVAGVTRAWAYPLEMGIGTITVRFMMDDLRKTANGYPNSLDISNVTAYLNKVRPVTVKDFFVVSPIAYPISYTIEGLESDTPDVRANIYNEIQKVFREKAKPGQTMYGSWISEAISRASGEDHHTNNIPTVSVPSVGHMPELGPITYA